MKRVKIFFFSTLLLLLGIGIFAGKKRYTSGSIYAYSGGQYCQLTTSATLFNLTTVAAGIQASIIDYSGNACALYLYNSGIYTPLYFMGCL